MEDITWTVNGKSSGKGLKGFDTVLSQLENLPQDSFLTVRYHHAIWNETIDGYKEDDPFPFRDHDELRKHLDKIRVERRIVQQLENF